MNRRTLLALPLAALAAKPVANAQRGAAHLKLPGASRRTLLNFGATPKLGELFQAGDKLTFESIYEQPAEAYRIAEVRTADEAMVLELIA